jgi:hypothetical protein
MLSCSYPAFSAGLNAPAALFLRKMPRRVLDIFAGGKNIQNVYDKRSLQGALVIYIKKDSQGLC